MIETIIRRGTVIDGTGNPGRRCDVGIRDGKIYAIGDLKNVHADLVIDAEGMIVCPGFIDAHSHTDRTAEMNPFFESTIRQGVTTEIVGNCGSSAGITAEHGLAARMRQLEQAGMSANLAWLIGHNTLRANAGITGRAYTEAQYQAMEAALRTALEDGAYGMSSGLEFIPGRDSDPAELMRLTKVLSEYSGTVYASHIRNRDANVLPAVTEFLDIIRAHRIRGEISHMNIRHHTHAPEHAFEKCVALIEEARHEGLDVLTDMTPLNYGTGAMSGILPSWLTGAPASEQRAMLQSPDVRARLRGDCDRYWRFIASGEWERVRVQGCEAFPELVGLTFPEISAKWGKDPWDCYFDILAEHAPDYGKCGLVSYLFTDEHLRETIAHPLYMLVVDGFSTSVEGEVSRKSAFPLHYIGMAWFLTHHVRKLGTLRLEEAIRKMTSMPAQHFSLENRGLLQAGYHADICVFDFDRLETPFDLQNPRQYTQGMGYVFVNGQLVLREGEHLHTTPGRCLRRSVQR